MTVDFHSAPTICFVGLANLPVLAREYGRHGVGGAELQQTLLAKALVARATTFPWSLPTTASRTARPGTHQNFTRPIVPTGPIPVLRFVHPRWDRSVVRHETSGCDVYYTVALAPCWARSLCSHACTCQVIFRVAVIPTATRPHC